MEWLNEYVDTESWMNSTDCSEIEVTADGMFVYENEEEIDCMHVVVTDKDGKGAPKHPGSQPLLFRFYDGERLVETLRLASIEEMDQWHEQVVGYSAIDDNSELADVVRSFPDIAAADFIAAICIHGMFRIAAGESIELEHA